MSSEEIFEIVKEHTSLYQEKGMGAFTQFATKCGADYLKAQTSRKRSKNSRIERKIIYVMKEKDRAFLAHNLANYQQIYELYIKKLENDGYEKIGYARKSPCDSEEEKRKENLQKMIDFLKERSLAQLIYVSPRCLASSPIASRDMPSVEEELKKM